MTHNVMMIMIDRSEYDDDDVAVDRNVKVLMMNHDIVDREVKVLKMLLLIERSRC